MIIRSNYLVKDIRKLRPREGKGFTQRPMGSQWQSQSSQPVKDQQPHCSLILQRLPTSFFALYNPVL